MSSEYCVLKFTPAPEFVDPVNVALLTSEGSVHFYYEYSFPRLKCAAPDFDPRHLAFLLDDLSANLKGKDFNSAIEQIKKQNVQFALSEIRKFDRPVTSFDIDILKQNYLLKYSINKTQHVVPSTADRFGKGGTAGFQAPDQR